MITVSAGADGTFSTRVDISTVQSGTHVVTAVGTGSGYTASGSFDVDSRVCATTGTSPATLTTVATPTTAAQIVVLASTGLPSGTLTAFAVAAMLAGTVLLLVLRRRPIAVDGEGNTSRRGHLH